MELKRSETQLIEAVSTIITEEGFSKIGINKIARTAGCDKVLIYRYFGGLDGLIAVWAKKHDFYIQAYDTFINRIEEWGIYPHEKWENIILQYRHLPGFLQAPGKAVLYLL